MRRDGEAARGEDRRTVTDAPRIAETETERPTPKSPETPAAAGRLDKPGCA